MALHIHEIEDPILVAVFIATLVSVLRFLAGECRDLVRALGDLLRALRDLVDGLKSWSSRPRRPDHTKNHAHRTNRRKVTGRVATRA